MELNIPFAQNGEKSDFSINPDVDNKISLDKGYTLPYQLKPIEGGLFIDRKVFNQLMFLTTKEIVDWRKQAFPNWSSELSSALAYKKNAIVKYTNGNNYVSLVDNNTSLPTDTNNWVNFEDFGSLNINALDEKITPVNTDNLAIQEVGGLLKKLSFSNLKATLFNGAMSLTKNGYIKFPTVMGGVILQWGADVTSPTSNVEKEIIYPISFTSNPNTPMVSNSNSSNNYVISAGSAVADRKTSFKVYSAGAGVAFSWFAIGF